MAIGFTLVPELEQARWTCVADGAGAEIHQMRIAEHTIAATGGLPL